MQNNRITIISYIYIVCVFEGAVKEAIQTNILIYSIDSYVEVVKKYNSLLYFFVYPTKYRRSILN